MTRYDNAVIAANRTNVPATPIVSAISKANKKAVLSQENRAMPQLLFLV